MSALHFIDLIQREDKILVQFSEHLNVSAEETSGYSPGVFYHHVFCRIVACMCLNNAIRQEIIRRPGRI